MQTLRVHFTVNPVIGHEKARRAFAGRALRATVRSEGSSELDRCTYIGTAVKGTEIKAGTENVQPKAGGKLGIFFNTVVIAVTGQVVADTRAQLGVTPGIKLGTNGQPLGVVLKAEGFFLGEVQFGGDHVVVALVGDGGGNHGVEFEGAFLFAQLRATLGRVQLHRNQVFNYDTCVPLTVFTEGIGSANIQVEAAFVRLILVAVELVVLKS